MELPLDIFDEITGLTGMPAPVTESEYERRQHHRFPIGSRANISPVRNGVEGPANAVLIRDISLAGIGFLHAEAMKQGDVFNIEFKTPSDGTVRLQCVAQRSESGGCGKTQFIVGATFQALIEPKDGFRKSAASTPQTPPPLKSLAKPTPAVAIAESAKETFLAQGTAADGAATPAPSRGIFSAAKPSAVFNMYEVATRSAENSPGAANTALPTPRFKETPLPPDDTMPEAPKAAAVEGTDEAHAAESHVETSAPENAASIAVVEASPAPLPLPPPPAPAIAEPEKEAPKPIEAAVTASVATEAAAIESTKVEALKTEEVKIEMEKIEKQPVEKQPVDAVHTEPTMKIIPQAPVAPGRNQEILAKARARVLNQNQVLQDKVHELDEANQQLAKERAAAADASRERNELKAQLAEERSRSAGQVEALLKEVAALKETMTVLKIKSEADDKAISELAASLGIDGNSDVEQLKDRLSNTQAA